MINRFFGIQKHETVDAVLNRHRGIGPGFDLLRILLSLYIFYGHTLWVAGTRLFGDAAIVTSPLTVPLVEASFTGWTRPNHIAAVPVFFALSGFLVMGSSFRLRKTSTFLAFRFMRIFPALLVEVSLCALVLGPMLTRYTPASYFSDWSFFRYFGNVVGWITFNLPGLFWNNPVRYTVNQNLWTLPSEFDCYLITAILMMTGLLYKRIIFTIVFISVTLVFAVLNVTTNFGVTPGLLPPFAITYYFFMGVFFYHWKDVIPAHWAIALPAAIVAYMLLMGHHTVFLVPAFITYCMVFFGLVHFPKIPLIRSGDYSYGIYLYGFPIAQALIAAFPQTFMGHRYRLLLCAGLCTCLFAAFSWHMVEKHVLALKRHLPKKWFPLPQRPIRQTPEGREQQAEATSITASA